MTQRAQRRVQKSAAIASQQAAEAAAARPEPVLASEIPETNSGQRVTLSLVPRINEGSKRNVFATSILLVLLVFGVIITLVLLNTSVAQRQYDIVSMRNEERALSQENQALHKEAESLAAPQSLAVKARELGLVSPGAPGLVSLGDGKITQPAEVAEVPEEGSPKYDILPLPGQSINGARELSGQADKPESKSADAADDAADAEVKKAEVPQPTVGQKAKDAQKSEASEDAKDAKGTAESEATGEKSKDGKSKDGQEAKQDSAASLNGGSIPAPNLKTPTE